MQFSGFSPRYEIMIRLWPKKCSGRTFNSLSSFLQDHKESLNREQFHLCRGLWPCDADSIIVSGESDLWHALLVACTFCGGPSTEARFYCFLPMERVKGYVIDVELIRNPGEKPLTLT